MTSITITFMTSISAIVMEPYVKKTYRREKKRYFTTKCTVIATIFDDSVSGLIPVAVVNKRTNGPVNAHLISEQSIRTKPGNK